MTDREIFPEEQLLRLMFSDPGDITKESKFKELWGDGKSRKILHENLNSFLAQLPPRECQVLRLYYGLFDGWKFTPDEIGEKLGLKVDRINVILEKLIKKMKDPITIYFLSHQE
jgi:RNA polymerase sigma factor (sigma-70 family)